MMKPGEYDHSGQDLIKRNMLFTVVGYMVNLGLGFVLPRLISDSLGQATLGIWDFSWSVVTYFSLVQLGISGSVDRYVAAHRAKGDHYALNRSVSTIGVFLKVAGGLALLFCVCTVLWVIPLFTEKLGAGLRECQWIVLFLGIEIAGSIMLSVYGGVVTGCHRWDIHNLVQAAFCLLMALAMMFALAMGNRLPTLAAIHCIATLSGDCARFFVARRVCPEFRMNFRLFDWATLREQAGYSSKCIVPLVGRFLSNNMVSILITVFLGPLVLAMYSRSNSLVRQAQSLCAKLGYILIPTASSLSATGERDKLRAICVSGSTSIALAAMPLVITLVIMGDDVLRLWMGQQYVVRGLTGIIAVGLYYSLVQQPIWAILSGMNSHGKLAFLSLLSAVASGTILVIALGAMGCSLIQTTIGFLIPQILVDGVAAPMIARQKLDWSLRDFYYATIARPVLLVSPFAAVLLVARFVMDQHLAMGLVLMSLAFVLLGLVYWRHVIPGAVKKALHLRVAAARIENLLDV